MLLSSLRLPRSRRRTQDVAVVAVVAILSSALGLQGTSTDASAAADPTCTHTWDAGGDNVNWQDALNWSPNVVPGNGTTGGAQVACIGATYSVEIQQGERQTVRAVVADGTITIHEGAKLFTNGNPTTAPSRIATITVGEGATLGGNGTLTITNHMHWYGGPFSATMTTREVPTTSAPFRFGVTVIAPGADLLIDDILATACAPLADNGVNLSDGRRIENYGKVTIAPCAYVAADWGTQFNNYGVTELLGTLGYFEGFLQSDLVWPTSPPIFTNNAGAKLQRRGSPGVFTMAARFSGSGVVTVAFGTTLSILDAVNSNVTQLTSVLARTAASAVGSCPLTPSGQPSACTPASAVQTEAFRNASRSAAPNASVKLQQSANCIGCVYGTTSKTEAGEQLAVAVTSGSPTAADPFVITIEGGTPAGSAATQYSVGQNGSAIPFCGSVISNPCLASRTKLANGDIRLIVKTTSLALTIVPLGPRLLR